MEILIQAAIAVLTIVLTPLFTLWLNDRRQEQREAEFKRALQSETKRQAVVRQKERQQQAAAISELMKRTGGPLRKPVRKPGAGVAGIAKYYRNQQAERERKREEDNDENL